VTTLRLLCVLALALGVTACDDGGSSSGTDAGPDVVPMTDAGPGGAPMDAGGPAPGADAGPGAPGTDSGPPTPGVDSGAPPAGGGALRVPEEQEASYREILENVPAIDFREGFVSDEEAALQGAAVDCLIQNYGQDHLTSGGPHISQALVVPQICVDNPYCREILGDAAIYIDPSAPAAEALERAVNDCTSGRLGESRLLLAAQRPHFEWPSLVPSYERLYRRLLT